jgi:hypothetical protein
MSKSRTDLKSALRSLDVSKPLRIPPQLGFAAPKVMVAVDALPQSNSLNAEETGAKLDTVQIEQSPKQTVSKMDSVCFGSSAQEIVGEIPAPTLAATESNLDGVQNGSCLRRTGSNLDSVQNERTLGVTDVFTMAF